MDNSFEDSIRSISNLDILLVWLLVDNSENEGLQHTFLLAYRPMVSIDEVLDSLSRMSEMGRLPPKYCKSFILLWVTSYYTIDWKKKTILPRLLEFSRKIINDEDYNLLRTMCVREIGARRNQRVQSIPSAGSSHKSPRKLVNMIYPARPKSANSDLGKEWSGVPTHVLATQMTIMEQELFCDVQPSEFLKECWQGANREILSPRLSTLVKRFNDVSYWVATQVVSSPSPKHQAMVIRKFIKVAYKLYQFHNYNSLMQIISGLHNVSVSRLRPAWAALPGNALDKFKKINEFMSASQNFQQYREVMNDLAANKIPALPYLVLFMRDITFIEENSDTTAEGNPNFLKIFRLGKQLAWFNQFTNIDYGYTNDLHIQKVLMDLKFLSDSELYHLSLMSEPKHTGTLGPSHLSGVSEINGGASRRGSKVKEVKDVKESSWRRSACWGVKVEN